MSTSLKSVPYQKHTGFEPDLRAHLPILPKRHMVIIDAAVSGDQPKDFIRVYEYGRTARKKNQRTWTPYIAKVAGKWYPNECITEHLLNRLGHALGVPVANSRLVLDEEFEQVRFLSEYFLKTGERLEHGAEIFAGYLSDDQLVEEIEKDRRTSRNLFTFQFAECALKHRFGHGDVGQKLIKEFVRMLGFDAITGNNDRHTYNWGIICDLNGKRAPRFSPIYDSARGLLWNEPEQRLLRFTQKDKDGTTNLEKYVRDSMPRIGWEGTKDQNHFELACLIYQNRPEFRYIFDDLLSTKRQTLAKGLLEEEFEKLFSPIRYDLIKKCLDLRIQKLINIFTQIQKEERT
ncbi:MAG: HipA domain-containing protein [Bacteroidetes bacterium]|nr:HipA domain-containing protein [Bacteroidota bacterium]